jgi:hypothetical protein
VPGSFAGVEPAQVAVAKRRSPPACRALANLEHSSRQHHRLPADVALVAELAQVRRRTQNRDHQARAAAAAPNAGLVSPPSPNDPLGRYEPASSVAPGRRDWHVVLAHATDERRRHARSRGSRGSFHLANGLTRAGKTSGRLVARHRSQGEISRPSTIVETWLLRAWSPNVLPLRSQQVLPGQYAPTRVA